MLLNWCAMSDGVLNRAYRKQLLATLIVTLIAFSHGIALGWLSPMLSKLHSSTLTPLGFTVSVTEASWIGALVTVGGMMGNILYGCFLDILSRKTAMYTLAVPHLVAWLLVYWATSIEFLYVARICAGLTGGGLYVVLPIYIGEISESSVRGRLTSMFTLTMNSGILVGFILSSHLPYKLIPSIVSALPILYLCLVTYLPDTPQHLLRCGYEQQAEQSFKFYRNYATVTATESTTKTATADFEEQFRKLRLAVTQQKLQSEALSHHDYLNKRALKAVCTGVVLMAVNCYTGQFALINYMSSIFVTMKTELHPDTNTIIIGVVQIVGLYTSTLLVDRYGRKVLMISSTAGMGVGLAALGLYAFFAEETDADLSAYSAWLPLLLMAFVIFMASIGVISVTFVLLVEIVPAKIRSVACSFCLTLLAVFGFGLLKGFPVFMHTFGLSAAMWFCACVCASGLFYISIFLEETKGKNMDVDEENDS